MTAPYTGSSTALPSLPRVLSPDEFEHAQLLSPAQLGQAKFPVVPPPFAPRDATAGRNPKTGLDERANANAVPLTGAARILTRYVAGPMLDNPLTTVATVALPGAGAVMGGLMAKDLTEYAAQKTAEMSLSPEDRARAEADPSRIKGEQAAVELAMLLAGPLIHGGMKALRGDGPAAVAKTAAELPAGPPEQSSGTPGPFTPEQLQVAHQALLEHARQTGDPAATKAAGDLERAMAGGTERFSGLPIDAELRSRVQQHMADVKDAWDLMFAPANRSPEAKQAANILRATTGEQAGVYEQAAFKLDEFRRAIDPMPDADKFAFIDAIEGGRSQPNPEFHAPADAMRKILDDGREAVRALGTGKLDQFIEHYFPHIWTDPERAADAFALAGSKRPLAGSGSFLKERTIPTTAEGLRLGLQPVSSNPVDLTLLKVREMQRYVMAHQSLAEMQDAGLVKFVRAGEGRPDGYTRIQDNIATVFGPRTDEGATTIRGEYWAPEPVARVVNNYLSPGLRGNAIYDAYRGLGNALNQAQLGLSGFHLMFTSMDASVSRTALGLEYLASGKPSTGLAKIASSPIAPFTNIVFGKKIREAYLNPRSATSEMQALANAVKEAGGRVRMDSFYQNSAPEKMIAAWRDGEYAKAAGLSIPALIEAINKPLMEHIVPMQKLGVFGDLATKVLADLPPEATLADRRAALAQAWDSVDNRMGQLVYDNLFWNKTFKDMAMASVRSVGWNIGTIRELGGGLGDLASAGTALAKGDRATLTHRAAYVAALPMMVGMYGAAYQYLRTGEGPQEMKDYFFPRTGEQDADGNPERVQIASYMKDLIAYAGDPWQTVKHKMHPLLGAVYEMLQNQDYYGDQIRNPDDPAVKQLQQGATFVAEQALPFSLRNMREAGKRGDGPGTTFGQLFGITPAPRARVRSDAQNRMNEYLAQRGGSGGATPEDVAARAARADILSGLRSGHVDLDAVHQAVENQQLTPKDVVRLLRLAGSTPAQEKFKRLTMPQALDVFQRSTDREKAMFAQALITKVERAMNSQ